MKENLVLPKNTGHFINGKFVESISKKKFKVINPTTERGKESKLST